MSASSLLLAPKPGSSGELATTNGATVGGSADAPLHDELQSVLSRRGRRLSALERLSRTGGAGAQLRAFFASAAPPIYAYYGYIAVARLPDILDDPSSEVDFLLASATRHGDLFVAAGLLAAGAGLGRVVTRAAMDKARETYGEFAAWVLLRPRPTSTRAAAALPGREEAYAIGHGGYRVFLSQQRPGFETWVDVVCANPRCGILVNPHAASASYHEAREHLRRWEALNAAHQK